MVTIQQPYESIIHSQYSQLLPGHHTITIRWSSQCSIPAAISSSGLKIQRLETVPFWELGLPIEPNRSISVRNLLVHYHTALTATADVALQDYDKLVKFILNLSRPHTFPFQAKERSRCSGACSSTICTESRLLPQRGTDVLYQYSGSQRCSTQTCCVFFELVRSGRSHPSLTTAAKRKETIGSIDSSLQISVQSGSCQDSSCNSLYVTETPLASNHNGGSDTSKIPSNSAAYHVSTKKPSGPRRYALVSERPCQHTPSTSS
jgi:hypothetical protein